jgi:polysaccharide biosynthesis/export protein
MMRLPLLRQTRKLVLALLMVVCLSGCASQRVGRHRMKRYTPEPPRESVFPDRPATEKKPSKPEVTVTNVTVPPSDTIPDSSETGSEAEPTDAALTTPSNQNVKPPSPPSADKRDLLQAADRIVITWSSGFDEGQHRDVIDGTGAVNLKYIGRIRLHGLTTAGAEDLIENAFINKGIYTSVTVSVIKEQEELYVQGEVVRPGAIPVTSGLTLTQAIGKAGGFGTFAKKSRIYLTRSGKTSVYDYDKIVQKGELDPQLEAGDVINVDRRW